MKRNVRDYGAAGDGCTKDTAAIQRCIDAAGQSGGGTVTLDNGTFVAGTLYMRSGVTLGITESAVLLASPCISDYGTDTHYNRYRNEKNIDRCWIYAEGAEDFGIRGRGVLNGNAEAFPNEGSIYRPMMMRFLRCRNIHIEGVRMLDAAAWTTAFLDSSDIWIRDVYIKNEKRYNGDGLDFDGCSNVFVDNCYIEGTDDNLCLQAGSREYPVKNIHITNCTFSSLCAGIRIGLKSIGDISNVVVSSCTMENIRREGIKIECTEGGTIHNILINNIAMKNVRRPLFVLLNNRFLPEDLGNSVEIEEIPEIGRMSHLIFSNISAEDDEEMAQIHKRFGDDIMGAPWFNGIRIDAEQNHKIEDVTIDNLRYVSIGGVKAADIPEQYPQVLDQLKHPGEETSGNYYPDWSRTACMDIRNVEGLYLGNVGLKAVLPDKRPPYLIENCAVIKKEIYCAGYGAETEAV